MKPTCRQIGLCDIRVTDGVCVSLSNELSDDESTDENPYRLSTIDIMVFKHHRNKFFINKFFPGYSGDDNRAEDHTQASPGRQ